MVESHLCAYNSFAHLLVPTLALEVDWVHLAAVNVLLQQQELFIGLDGHTQNGEALPYLHQLQWIDEGVSASQGHARKVARDCFNGDYLSVIY